MIPRIAFLYMLLIQALFLSSVKLEARVTLSGYVRDHATGEELIGVNVAILETGSGTVTNAYGYYSLTVDPGFYTLVFSYVGYRTERKPLSLGENMGLDIELNELAQELEEVVISAEGRNANITRLETGSTRLPIQTIRKIPAFMGEVDVIKAIQLLPGVQVTSEGSSGFSVRGGSPDQNLILLDEANVYNASHLMGFFSVFNNDAIKDVKLYKGDIPASSGGRLASMLDIRMKEGNSREFHLTGGIGTISSKITLEGPVLKDRASFLLSGRRTYADIFLALSRDTALRDNRLFFYDLNGKFNYNLNDNNRIYVSGYFGKDVFANDFSGMYFGNRTISLRWNHLFSKTLFSNFTLVHSHYFYDLGTPENSRPFFSWVSYLDDYGAKGDFTWYLSPEHTLEFGLSSYYHTIKPGTVSTGGTDGGSGGTELPYNHALESALYFSGKSKVFERLAVRYGIRSSLFNNIGPATQYSYNEDWVITDSVYYGRGDFFHHYLGLEPRLAVNLLLSEKNSLKASYSRTRQFMQIASNSAAGNPLDIWFPASPNIRPQVSDQISVGYFRNFLDNRIESSLEVYYKKMNNAIDFRDHAQLFLNPRLEAELRVGEATSYGAELLVKYQYLKFSGWFSYTLSKTTRDFRDINGGNPYPAPYDKPHDLAVVFSWDIIPRLALGSNWIYSSGIPYTLPSGKYVIKGNTLPLYTGRNEYRLPAYHRLDISLTLKGKNKPGRHWYNELSLSVYNAYARKNIWTLNFIQDDVDPNVNYAEMTYLFSIIPAISYNFHF